MKAKFGGVCICGARFKSGDEIDYRDKKVIGCPSCAQRDLIDTKETPEELADRLKFRTYEWTELLQENTNAEGKEGTDTGR